MKCHSTALLIYFVQRSWSVAMRCFCSGQCATKLDSVIHLFPQCFIGNDDSFFQLNKSVLMKKEDDLHTRYSVRVLYLLLLIGCLRDFQHSTVKQTDVGEFC